MIDEEPIDEGKCRIGALSVVRDYLRLTEGEHFLIVHDETTKNLVGFIQEQAMKLGAIVELVGYDQNEQEQIALSGDLPPELVRRLHDADCILNSLSSNPKCTNFRKSLIKTGLSVGTRIAHMPGLNISHLARVFLSDFNEMMKWNTLIFRILYFASKCTIYTKSIDQSEHFELHLDLDGPKRMPSQSTGIPRDGSWCNIPGSEVYIAPIEEYSQGRIVINGSMLGHVLGDNEVTLHFQQGLLTKWTTCLGRLKSDLQNSAIAWENDSSCKMLCEFGIGLNSRLTQLTGIGPIDEKARGTVHIAIGDNTEFGGRNESQIHEDFVTKSPDVVIDGKKIMENGQFTIDEKDCFESLQNMESDIRGFRGKRFRVTNLPTTIDDGKLCLQLSDARLQDFLLQIGDDKAARQSATFMHYLMAISRVNYQFNIRDIDQDLENVPQLLGILTKYGLIREVSDA